MASDNANSNNRSTLRSNTGGFSSLSLKIPPVFPVTSHTDFVGPNSTFVAIKGMREDGVRYIPLALARGARTIVVQEDAILDQLIIKQIEQTGAELKLVKNARLALAHLSGAALKWPSRKLHIIAVTGTKGKTTTTFLLEHIFRKAGYKTALLSSVKNRIIEREFSTHLTTQHPDYLHVFLDLCVQAGVDWVIMEVAAQAKSLYRVEGILFDGLVFTNFAQEHGEFYPTLDDYFNAKKALLAQLKPYAPCALNKDDVRVRELALLCQKPLFFSQAVICASLQESYERALEYSEVRVMLEKSSLNSGLQGMIATRDETRDYVYNFELPALIGNYNGANCAAAATVAQALGVPLGLIRESLSSFAGVPGRLQRFALPNGAHACIDYASNPLSFKAILETLRPFADKLILVFGSGGDRERARRPLLGQMASEYADYIILTTDNPRSEDPYAIIEDIKLGIPEELKYKVSCELDREQAIYKAYALSEPGTIIALLGKGAEEYQIYNGVKSYFSEAKILDALWQQANGSINNFTKNSNSSTIKLS